jgi:hypothetical protein
VSHFDFWVGAFLTPSTGLSPYIHSNHASKEKPILRIILRLLSELLHRPLVFRQLLLLCYDAGSLRKFWELSCSNCTSCIEYKKFRTKCVVASESMSQSVNMRMGSTAVRQQNTHASRTQWLLLVPYRRNIRMLKLQLDSIDTTKLTKKLISSLLLIQYLIHKFHKTSACLIKEHCLTEHSLHSIQLLKGSRWYCI